MLKRFGNELCLYENSDTEPPSCAHGPAMLFERFWKNKERRKFYACSAYRDRKLCSFFQWQDDYLKKRKRLKLDNERQEKREFMHSKDPHNSENLKEMYQIAKKSETSYCHTCKMLFLEKKEPSKHLNHEISKNLGLEQLRKPSYFLHPLENAKAHAQYLFDDSVIQFMLSQLDHLGFSKVVCLGTPRVHEAIQQHGKFQSILMDLDDRYEEFFPTTFLHFNMFNFYFFREKDRQTYTTFLKDCVDVKKEIVFVTDPPFGGLVESITETLKRLWNINLVENIKDKTCPLQHEMDTLWFFPYFMESKIIECLPSFTMMDYKVSYQNHPLFNEAKGGKRGSPVRIFTNIAQSKFELPKSEGYKHCQVCQRDVSLENVHCIQCNACTSKNGLTYHHCDLCKECVKPNRSHCEQCGRCQKDFHTCETLESG